MAAKTLISDQEFADILAQYPLGSFVRAEPIAAGTVQTNYRLFTSQGKLIFRCYENRAAGSVRFECNLLRYLKARGYPCPAVLRDHRGQSVGRLRGKPFALFEFIEGQPLEHPGPDQQQQLIHKVAELQTLTRGYRPAGWQQRWNYSPTLARELARQAAQRIDTVNAWQKLDWFLGEVDDLDLPRALPKGICHCDFHFSNILFNEGQFAALIDFDDANYTYLTYDLVTLLNPFLPAFEWDTWQRFDLAENVLDFTQARAVAAEYARHRPLSRLEQRHLFDVFKLSLLFDCIWYFERGDAADFYEKRKLDALNRLGGEGFFKELF